MKKMDRKLKNYVKDTLLEAVDIYSPSRNCEPMINWASMQLSMLSPDSLTLDSYGNVHATFKYGDGDTVVCLNAHVDTVTATVPNKVSLYDDKDVLRSYVHGIQTVLGADDRAGVTAVLATLKFLKGFDGTVKVSFFKDEEVGCIGSSNANVDFYNDVDLAITYDRRGSSDIVVGTWGTPFCCDEVGLWLEQVSTRNNYDYQCVSGGLSDAYSLSKLGVNSVNLSVGYYNEHTSKEELHLSQLLRTIRFAMIAIKDLKNVKDNFTLIPVSNQWVEGYTYGGVMDKWGDIDGYNYSYNYGTDYSSYYAPDAYYSSSLKVAVIDDGLSEIVLYSTDEIDDLIASLQKAKKNMMNADKKKNNKVSKISKVVNALKTVE